MTSETPPVRVEVRIEKLVAGGDGLARVDGLPVFVPRSAPGDRLLVDLVERHRDYARAEIVELLEPGPGRREPPCPHFDRCGGCDLQHLEDRLQVDLKVAAVRETLERLGRVEWPAEVEVVAGDAWGYRLRSAVRTRPTEGGFEVGYFERLSHRLVPVDCCPVLVPELERVLSRLPAALAGEAPARLDLAVGEDGSLTTAPVVEGLGHGEVSRRVGEHLYAYDARCFFQGHAGLLAALVDRVVGDERGEQAVDLYAGVGLFTLPLAGRYGQVVAVEGDRVAARYARINGRRNRLGNIEVVAASVDAWVEQLPADVDRLVVDPPRSGMTRRLRRAIAERRPRRLTYVSCHPAALARDLRELRHHYRLLGLTLLDLFPQTGHMEVVAQLAAP